MKSYWNQNTEAYQDKPDNSQKPNVSFEFFPANNDQMADTLQETIQRLSAYQPTFVSVTYGAGGSSRERTDATLRQLKRRKSLSVAGHLTCSGDNKAQTDSVINRYRDIGIKHIVALRGDLPRGSRARRQPQDGYRDALALINAIRTQGDFDISVAGYPELHPDARNTNEDIAYLKAKVDAGANRILTQFFFDNNVFYRFRDKAVKAGIQVPIVPGILPITDIDNTIRFARRCKASVPVWISGAFQRHSDIETRQLIASSLLAEQCTDLVRNGVDDLHFYTLNRHELVSTACELLGLGATQKQQNDDRLTA